MICCSFSFAEQSESQKVALHKRLCDVGLVNDKWPVLLEEQCGVQSWNAVQYIGREFYIFLLQYAVDASERKGLRKLLRIEAHIRFYREEQKDMLLKRQNALHESLKMLEKFQSSRDDSELENRFREILQVPKYAWFGMKFDTDVVASKITLMAKNIDEACKIEDFHPLVMLKNASGSFDSQQVVSLALRGINPIRLSVHDQILRLPRDIQLDFPMRSQYFEQVSFKSKNDEQEFLTQVALLGCAKPNSNTCPVYNGSLATKECYYSTLKYFFVPLASCILDDTQLQLTDEVLSHLAKIDNAISDGVRVSEIENECNVFLNKYGTHSLQGPFHFGGLYVCKCFTIGCGEDDKQAVQWLHEEVIDAHIRMKLDLCSENICIVDIQDLSGCYSDELKTQTYFHVAIYGGSEKVVGFPDWKISLLASNSKWKLIDCGTCFVPVWEIILKGYIKRFKNFARIALTIEKQCKKHNRIDPKLERIKDEIGDLVQSWSRKMKPPFVEELQVLINKRSEVVWRPTFGLPSTSLSLICKIFFALLSQRVIITN